MYLSFIDAKIREENLEKKKIPKSGVEKIRKFLQVRVFKKSERKYKFIIYSIYTYIYVHQFK